MSDFYSLFERNKPTPPTGTVTTLPTATPGTASSYAAAALRREAEAVERAPEGTRNDTLNAAAFKMGRHVGAGNIDADTVRATLAEAATRAGLPAHEIDTVLRDSHNSGINQGQNSPRHPAPLTEIPAVTVLDAEPVPDLTPEQDEEFWASRDLLTHLHTFARARMVSPWAVLGAALARVITATPNQVCLPPIVGGKASLNLFIGLVGPSGSGKGAAEAVAAEALDVGPIVTHNVGSGEGIAHGFKRREKGELVWNDDEHAVLFSVPEIDSLAAQGDRKGATLMPQLRSGWTGEQLGFGYADPTKRIIVEAHQYRLCLVAGIQPARAACLLDDSDGGTPQRFLWLPATDPGAPEVEPDAPSPQSWAPPRTNSFATFGGVKVAVCDTARDTIREARRARNRGDGDALDGHSLLARLKTAAALGILDGRYEVTDADWDLAGVVMAKSDATRDGCRQVLAIKAKQANMARAEADAHREVIVTETVTDAAVTRVCGVIARRLKRDEWLPRIELRRALASRDRAHFEEALDRLLAAGRIELDESATGHGNAAGKYRLRENA